MNFRPVLNGRFSSGTGTFPGEFKKAYFSLIFFLKSLCTIFVFMWLVCIFDSMQFTYLGK